MNNNEDISKIMLEFNLELIEYVNSKKVYKYPKRLQWYVW